MLGVKGGKGGLLTPGYLRHNSPRLLTRLGKYSLTCVSWLIRRLESPTIPLAAIVGLT